MVTSYSAIAHPFSLKVEIANSLMEVERAALNFPRHAAKLPLRDFPHSVFFTTNFCCREEHTPQQLFFILQTKQSL